MPRFIGVFLTAAVLTLSAACSSSVEGQPNEGAILTARSPVELRVVTETSPAGQADPAEPGQTTLPDRTGTENYLVGPAELTLSRFTKVESSPSQTGAGAVVTIGLLGDDAAKFGALTERNIGKRVAMVIDGKVVTAPTIQAAIPGGQIEITGQFTRKDADDLARQLGAR